MDEILFRLSFESYNILFPPNLSNRKVKCQEGRRINRPFSYMKKQLSVYLPRKPKKTHVHVISFYSTDKQLILDRHNKEAC
jgi:hypothetical protein